MKKYYFIMLLCMVVWPLSAQTPNEDTKQKTVTVRTGAYKPAKLDTILAEQPKPEPIKEPEPPKIKKEPSNKPWYNVFSISIVGGPIITKKFSGATIAGITFNDDTGGDGSKEGVFSFSYKRLKKEGLFFYGPGIRFKQGDFMGGDLFLHGQIELGGTSNFLGFNLKRLHPFANVSVGISYIDYNKNYIHVPEKCIFRYSNYTSYNSGYSTGNIYEQTSEYSGLKFYLDYSLGLAIALGRRFTMSISYHAQLVPHFNATIDLSDYRNEIQTWINSNSTNSSNNSSIELPYDIEKTTTLFHGIELSFRF